MADVSNNRISLVGSLLLNGKINPDSSFIQRYRSYPSVNINDFLTQLQYIDGAYISGSGEITPLETKTEIIPPWPENSRGFINLTIQDMSLSENKNKFSIYIPGINLSQNPKIMFLYLNSQDGYIEVKGSKKVFFVFNLFDKDYANLAKFYPDGGVWIDTMLVQLENPFVDDYTSGEFNLGSFYVMSRNYGPLRWETNYYFENYTELLDMISKN
jgi:hypothetical protein